MVVIKEAYDSEKKRRQTSRKMTMEDVKAKTQRAKALTCIIRQGKMGKEEIERNVEQVFGKGSKEEIEKVTGVKKIVERIEEMSKREAQLEEWEKMRLEAKRRRREYRRLNVIWRKNKCFPAQYDGNEETPGVEETLEFWRNINNKEASEGWCEDESIQEALLQTRGSLQ